MQPFPGSVKGIAWGNNQAKLIYNRTNVVHPNCIVHLWTKQKGKAIAILCFLSVLYNQYDISEQWYDTVQVSANQVEMVLVDYYHVSAEGSLSNHSCHLDLATDLLCDLILITAASFSFIKKSTAHLDTTFPKDDNDTQLMIDSSIIPLYLQHFIRGANF